ncbi:MAG: hypothetical protein AAB584_01560 [Patescibacteria group bacterium]
MINEELKNLVSSLGTLVIVENNQPKFIVMTYDKFNSVIHKSIDNSSNFNKDSNETLSVSGYHAQRDEEIVNRLNEEIFALKEQVVEKEKEFSNLSERSDSEHSDKF